MADSAFLKALLSKVSRAWVVSFSSPLAARQAAQALDAAMTSAAPFGVVPIGSIVAWTNHITGTPALPAEWAYCNGGAITDTDSPLYGQNTPALNGTIGADNNGYFLRGTEGPSGSGTTQSDATAVNGLSAAITSTANKQNTTGGAVHYFTTGSTATDGRLTTADTNLVSSTASLSSTDTETRPINFGVRWIIRIK